MSVEAITGESLRIFASVPFRCWWNVLSQRHQRSRASMAGRAASSGALNFTGHEDSLELNRGRSEQCAPELPLVDHLYDPLHGQLPGLVLTDA
jgi:hypothetical protein